MIRGYMIEETKNEGTRLKIDGYAHDYEAIRTMDIMMDTASIYSALRGKMRKTREIKNVAKMKNCIGHKP